MQGSSWYKSIILKSRQFMSYVKGWTWNDSADASTKRPDGSFIVPQKYSEPVGTYYSFLNRFNVTPNEYIRTIDGQYEIIPDDTVRQVLADYRNDNNFRYGKNVGVSLRGAKVVQNQATEDFLLAHPTSGTYWKRGGITGSGLSDLSGGNYSNAYTSSFDIAPLDINPFDNTSKNIVMNFLSGNRRKPIVFPFNSLNQSSSQTSNYNFNMSFFVWKGWLDQEATQARLENISSGTGTVATTTGSAQAFRNPVIALNLLSQSDYERENKDNWLDDSNTYLAINYINESWDYYSDDQANNVPEYQQLSKCWKVSNVQFEEAPNDYVRIKIGFYIDGYDRILYDVTERYFRFPVLQIGIGDQMQNAEWFSRWFKNGDVYPPQYQTGYLAMFGLNTMGTQNFQQNIYKAWGKTCEIPELLSPQNAKYPTTMSAKYVSYFSNYLSNTTLSSRASSPTIYNLPNPKYDSTKYSGCKMLYLHFYFGNSSHGANNDYFGRYLNTTSRNFLTLNNNVPALISNQNLKYQGWGLNHRTSYIVPLFKYNPPASGCNFASQLPSEYLSDEVVRLPHGHNKIAIVTSSTENGSYIYINGKKYFTNQINDNLDTLSQVTLVGRSDDLLLEYGWFDEPLTDLNLLKLTEI